MWREGNEEEREEIGACKMRSLLNQWVCICPIGRAIKATYAQLEKVELQSVWM